MTNDVTIFPMGGFLVQQRTNDGLFNAADLLNQWNEIHGTDKSINDFIEEEIKFSIYFNGKDIPSISDDGWLDEFHFRNFLAFLSPVLSLVHYPCHLYNESYLEKIIRLFCQTSQHSTVDNSKNGTQTYILTDETGLYKIGKSKDVKRRVRSLMIGNPSIRLVARIPKDVESVLHDQFKDKRVSGEWFRLTDLDLDFIKELA